MPYWLQYDVFGAFGLLFGQIIFFVKSDMIMPKRIILAVWATYKKRLLHKNLFFSKNVA